MRDILATLESEHDQLRDLFAQMNATADTDSERRTELLERIEALLVPHAKWEEHSFYPAFAERASHEQLLRYTAAIEEHRAIELAVLPDLKACEPDTREFAGTAKVLGELTVHHSSEEEREMFPAARAMFAATELVQMDADYDEWKNSVAGQGAALYAKAKTGAVSMLRRPGSPG